METVIGAIVLLLMLVVAGLVVAFLVKENRRRENRRQEIARENSELRQSIRAKYQSVKAARAGGDVGDSVAYTMFPPSVAAHPFPATIPDSYDSGFGGDDSGSFD